MSQWYPGSNLTWQQYLQVNSFATDIESGIRRQSHDITGAITDQTKAIVGTGDQLLEAFESGLGGVAEALDGVGTQLNNLGAHFDYSMGLLLDELQVQSRLFRAIVEHLDAIKRTLESPLLTQARELFRIGCDRLSKGLLDKALEAFIQARGKNDADFFTEYHLGKLYLYGRDDDDDVIDLPKAREHLLAAVRFGKAEIAVDKAFRALTAQALLHASIACFALEGSESGDTMRRIQEALALVGGAVDLDPDLSEGWFHAAKYNALQGDAKKAIAALEVAVAQDVLYAPKAAADGAFSSIAPALAFYLDRLRDEACRRSEVALREAELAVQESRGSTLGESRQGQLRHSDAQASLAKAQTAHGSTTYLGYLQAIRHAHNAIKAAHESEAICAAAERRSEQLRAEEERRNAALGDFNRALDRVRSTFSSISGANMIPSAHDIRGVAQSLRQVKAVASIAENAGCLYLITLPLAFVREPRRERALIDLVTAASLVRGSPPKKVPSYGVVSRDILRVLDESLAEALDLEGNNPPPLGDPRGDRPDE